MLYEKIHLEDDERVLAEVRKHWFILFARLFWVVVVALLPLLFAAGAPTALPAYADLAQSIFPLLLYCYGAWLVVCWMAGFAAWTDYYLDIWAITNKRLIAINQQGFFRRSVGSFRLDRLQDMNVEIQGIVPTLLNFGTLQAQTAGGSEEEFRATGLPRPRELKALILRASDEVIDRPFASGV